MIRLYTLEKMQYWKRRSVISLALALGLVGAALIANIILCCQVNTLNARKMQLACIALFALAGWACILIFFFSYAPAKAQAIHMSGILSDQEETYEGKLMVHRNSFHIPKSISVRKATLDTAEGPISLNVSASLARKLPENGAAVRILAVRRFITGCEVLK